MARVLDWLDDPRADRGIHYFADGDWTFTSYRTIADQSRRVATLLRGSGVRDGVVSLVVGPSASFVPAFLGTMWAGLTPSPMASPLTFAGHEAYTDHAATVLRAAGSSAVLADATLVGLAGQAATAADRPAPLLLPSPDELPADDGNGRADAELALLQFTSGSSGSPKGVRVTPDNLTANVAAIHGWLGIGPDDSCSSWLPLYHDMGLIGAFLGSVVAQIDLHLMTPLDFITAPAQWLDCHGRRGVTITTAPNFGYAYATRRVGEEQLAGSDFSTWRVAMSGAERVDAGVAADFASRLAPHGFRAATFAPCYGMAEATLAVSGVAPSETARIVKPAGPLVVGESVEIGAQGLLGVDRPEPAAGWLSSCGRPVPATVIDIVDEDGVPVPAGCFGEIRVGGDSVAAGYQDVPSPAFSTDGLRTGDAGFLLDGELYVVGRVGDSLKVRGRKVHAEDLEVTLVGVDGIGAGKVAVALGSRDGRDNAVVVVEAADAAWLPAVPGVLRSVLDASVTLTVARVDRGAIPRTSSGKPRRRALWQLAAAGALPGEIVHDTFVPALVPPTADRLDGALT